MFSTPGFEDILEGRALRSLAQNLRKDKCRKSTTVTSINQLVSQSTGSTRLFADSALSWRSFAALFVSCFFHLLLLSFLSSRLCYPSLPTRSGYSVSIPSFDLLVLDFDRSRGLSITAFPFLRISLSYSPPTPSSRRISVNRSGCLVRQIYTVWQ